MRKMKRVGSFFIAMVLVLSLCYTPVTARTTKKENNHKVVVYIGQKKVLKQQGVDNKKSTFKVIGKKKLVKLRKNGKIEGKKAGTTTIRAKYKNKTYRWKVVVKKTYLKEQNITLAVGETRKLELMGTGIKNCQSLDENIVTVSEKGTIYAHSLGETKVMVTGKNKRKHICSVIVSAENGTTQEVTGTTEKPTGTTEKPTGTTEKPTGTTEKPASTTQKPASTTQKPASTTQTPAGTTQTPAGTTQKPASTTQKPASTTQTPAGTTQTPASTTQKPAGTTQTPADTTQTPAGTTQTPTGTTQKPAGTTQTPASTTQTPASTTQTPASTTQTPASTTQTPTGTTQTPASTTQTPASTTQTPTGTTQTPAGTTQTPAGTTQSPAGTTQTPTGTTQSPAGTTQTPTGTTETPSVEDQVKNKMREMVMNADFSHQDFSEYKKEYKWYQALWNQLLETDKELNIMSTCYGTMFWNCDQNGSIVKNLWIYDCDRESGKNITSETIKKRYQETKRRMREVESFIQAHPEMSEMEKVLYVHDYVVDQCSYLNDGYYSHCAGGMLGEGKGVCEGYAYAMKLLLEDIGIETIKLSSQSMNHGWDYVKVDGEWYHLDACWDDPVGGDPVVRHFHFIRNDEQFEQKCGHRAWTYGSDGTPQTIKSTSTKYNDWFVHDIKSRMVYQDGYWYYLKGNDVMKAKLDGSYNEKYKTVENATDKKLEEYIK